jgi:hypothetical protein
MPNNKLCVLFEGKCNNETEKQFKLSNIHLGNWHAQLEWARQTILINRDIYSVEYGGGCFYTNNKEHAFKRQAGRWLKKIAAWKYIAENPYCYLMNTVVWLDADCIIQPSQEDNFTRTIYDLYLPDSCIVHYGEYRRKNKLGTENGIVIFNNSRELKQSIIKEIVRLFDSGEFRKFPRWDDSYILGHLHDDINNNLSIADLSAFDKSQDINVISRSILRHFITHNKGTINDRS